MNRNYWEKIAPDYNEEIFDVLYNDKKSLIRSAIKKAASSSRVVMDAGCAVGKWLPVLSPLFKKVIATDISARNLEIAKKTYSQYGNIDYVRSDMSRPYPGLPLCDVIVCINAILTSSLKKRSLFFKNLYECLKKKGDIILVVPSLESWLLTRIIQHKWKIDKKLFNSTISPREAAKRYHDLQQGNAEIDNVATKHYLREELMLLLSQEGFEDLNCRKIEYKWNTEFVNPPAWLIKPGPWDWLITCRKAG